LSSYTQGIVTLEMTTRVTRSKIPPEKFPSLLRAFRWDGFRDLEKTARAALRKIKEGRARDLLREYLAKQPLTLEEHEWPTYILSCAGSSPLEKLATKLTVCKDNVYQLVRTTGDTLLPAIEAHIYDLCATDQGFLLHGLDAFPKKKSVIAFFNRFVKKNRHPSLDVMARRHRDRVKKGKKTTGWEL
jgi:hypothetical protein